MKSKFNNMTEFILSYRRPVALFLSFSMMLNLLTPFISLALTSGPSQPEVQSFEPVGTSNMVDLPTGDFTYNIPLLDVENYPVNISYHAGVNMDQEASWVGLGWNINAGVINRNVRGIPDDFDGDNIRKDFNMKPNETWTLGVNVCAEYMGYGGLGLSLAGKYNNYNGAGIIQGVNISVGASSGGKCGGSASLGISMTSSTEDGLTVEPNLSVSARLKANEQKDVNVGASIGIAFNSRSGLGSLTVGVHGGISQHQKEDKAKKEDKSNYWKNPIEHMEPSSGSSISGGSNVKSFILERGLNASSKIDFGSPTYTPSVEFSMKSFAISGRFTMGGEVYGFHGAMGVDGSYSRQDLADPTQWNPAYGYLNTGHGQPSQNAILDFNREKDVPYRENSKNLPLPNLTFDIYSVSGQGIGGSYRPYRSDFGYVFDPRSNTTSDSYSVGMEMGAGNAVHTGSDLATTDVTSSSGKWIENNEPANRMYYKSNGTPNPDFEETYFKEANEKSVESDQSFQEKIGGTMPVRFELDKSRSYDVVLKNNFVDPFGNKTKVVAENYRNKRDKRTQNLSYLKYSEYKDFAIQQYRISPLAKPNHIAEFTTLANDGARYIYGLPAYNTKQKEVTFAIGSRIDGQLPDHISGDDLNYVDGTITYNFGEDSRRNENGQDHYFSSVQTPAFAHSYLLTAILSSDYVDADLIRGPSDLDLGNYTRFAYMLYTDTFKWRTPMGLNTASYNEGLKSNTTDDKASYIYGEKELHYLDTIITKNYLAIFYKSPRHDGHGVQNVDGAVDMTSNVLKLDSIALFSKLDFKSNGNNAIPIKKVIFEYDYSLCPGVPNNDGGGVGDGKLTLKKIYFSYQNSFKARLSPYEFSYENDNPSYCLKAYDRWGGYKPNLASSYGVANDLSQYTTSPIPTAEFPYSEQDSITAQERAGVWSLTKIALPSGGVIQVEYSADDYGFVQNKRAMDMLQIVDYTSSTSPFDHSDITNYPDPEDMLLDLHGTYNENKRLYFKLRNPDDDIREYFRGDSLLYFRFLTNIGPDGGKYEYVPGYAELHSFGRTDSFGYVVLRHVNLGDGGTMNVHPVVKAAIQFGRFHLPKLVWGDMNIDDGTPLGMRFIEEMWNSSVLKGLMDAVKGPNRVLYDHGVGDKFMAGKSWIRLSNPYKRKYGGGSRVHKITIDDGWASIVGNDPEESTYGQIYDYSREDGASSGVATYEPILGGDENPWRKPIYTNIRHLLAPDESTYLEEPFGESLFPSPNIVYGRVTVSNLKRPNVFRHGVGKTVSEFFTARDFPTIPTRTEVDHKRDKPGALSLGSILKFIKHKEHMTATQGYCIETNDMAGKPKSQSVYQEGHERPLTSTRFIYKSIPYLPGTSRLINTCKVIHPDGSTSDNEIGVNYDFVADMRESTSSIIAPSLKINVDMYFVSVYPQVMPMSWQGYCSEETIFRSAVTTKIVQRYGILDQVENYEDGALTTVKNVAYDSETGEPLLTRTNNNYNDSYYTLKFPGYWYYKNMGLASKNIGMSIKNLIVKNGDAVVRNANQYFTEGDELALMSTMGNIKGWISEVGQKTIKILKKDGSAVNGIFNMKLIRSGFKNKTNTMMAQIITGKNPLDGLKTNIYEEVLQAEAEEFSNLWKVYCDCYSKPGGAGNGSYNSFVMGTEGNWKLWKNYTYLTDRVQSKYNGNTNIRKDGVFTSFNPFYKNVNGKWEVDYHNWTFLSEVTEFNPYGVEIESKDALGRYSAALYGYNQTLPVAVASNSRLQELGYDGFEDYGINSCPDNHFRFFRPPLNDTISHTGRHSLVIEESESITMTRQLDQNCENPPGCNLQFDITVITSPVEERDVAVLNGTPGFCIYEWNIISGAPLVHLKADGSAVVIKNAPSVVEVKATDSNGCTISKVIEVISTP